MSTRFIALILLMLATVSLSPLLRAETEDLSITTLGGKPIPVPTSHHQLLAYELNFVNSGNQPLRISRIEIWNQKTLLASYAGTHLLRQSLVYDPKTGPVNEKKMELKQGMGAFVFLSLEFPKGKTLPTSLEHKIWVTTATQDHSAAAVRLLSYPVPVSTDKPVVLGPPLHGSQWIAEAAFSPTSYHRRAVLPIDGKFYLAQRYAIDWERACLDGREAHGNMHNNENWQAYGYELLAVADGIISKVSDKTVPDNIPPGAPNPPPPISEASGNYVILHTVQNNKSYYILYAHMQPGSIKVKMGQKVTRGEVIGILGNSGNSAEPHLHLHVTDTNEAEKSNGVPFVFETVTLQGKAEDVDQDYGIWVMPRILTHTKISRMMPTENQLFYFNDNDRECPSQ